MASLPEGEGMNILILSIVVFIALTLVKDGLDMCRTRAEVDMIYRMCKFLTVCYLDEHPEEQEFFNEMMHKEDFQK